MKNLTTILLLIFTIHQSTAQFLVPKLTQENFGPIDEAYAINNAGDTIRGRLGAYTFMDGQLRGFNLKTESGKQKFKFTDVQLLAIKPWYDPMVDSGPFSVPDLLRMNDDEFNNTVVMEWAYFVRVERPNRRGKYILSQLLNPGFDAKIKIYADPNANQTATLESDNVIFTGGDDTSFIMIKDGQPSEIVKKNKYKDLGLANIFNDCEVLKTQYATEKFKWKDFAKHLWIYERECE